MALKSLKLTLASRRGSLKAGVTGEAQLPLPPETECRKQKKALSSNIKTLRT